MITHPSPRLALIAALALAGCTTTTINCSRGDSVQKTGAYNVEKVPNVRNCNVVVKKRGLIDKAQAETIKKVLEAGE